jgi:hypothetical protein
MNLFEKFRRLPMPLLMLRVTAKFLAGVAIGALLGKVLEPYGWWILMAAVVIEVPSTLRIVGGRGGGATPAV